MPIYAVFARDAKEVPTVVPERFSWLAFLLPPLFAALHGLWLELMAWVALAVLLVAAGPVIGGAAVWVYVLLMLWLGFEAPALRAAALRRRGFAHLTDLVAAGPDHAAVAALGGRGVP